MKNTPLAIVILIILLLPSQYLMISKPIYFGYDVQVHIKRIEQYHKAFLLGQIPPRLAPDIVNGTSYPLFVVNYHLPYIMAEPIMLLTKNSTLAFKLVMSTTYLASAVFMFLVLKKFGSNLASLVGAIVFAYLPYRFANLYFRGAIGESVSFMFIPLVLLGINKIVEGKKYGILLTAFSVFCLITSHTVIFLIFLPFFAAYTIFFVKIKGSQIAMILLASILGILMSSFQLLPSIFEARFLKFNEVLATIYTGQFINFFQLFRIPAVGINLGTHIQAGIMSLVFFAVGLLMLLSKNKTKVAVLIFIFIVATFLIISQSIFLWNNLPILVNFVYPWRFISLIVVCTSFLAMLVIDLIRQQYLKIAAASLLIFLTIFTSRHYFLRTGVDQELGALPTLTAYNESDPIWSNEKSFILREEFKTNSATKISNLSVSPFNINFDAESGDNSIVIIKRLYFPGWQMSVNGSRKLPEIVDGLISANLDRGKNYIQVYFKETNLRRFSNLLSVISIFAFFALYLLLRKHESKR